MPALVLTFGTCAANELADHATSATQMTAAANTFIATLSESQRKSLVFGLDDEDRATWSNLPIIMVQPNGVLVGDLSDEQRAAFHGLLRASTSSQGYAKFSGIMRLDDLLHDIETEQFENDPEMQKEPLRQSFIATRSSGNYAIAIFGEPKGGNWGWKLAGHHAAVNFTVSQGRVGFTPTFLGSSPMSVDAGPYAGWMALPHEGSRGVEFMKSLTSAQQATAMIDDEVAGDVFEGPGRRASLEKFEGLKVEELSVGQARLLRALVSEYVRNVDFDSAEAQLALIDQTGWDELWFSWRGVVDENGLFYYRLHGPRLLIEYNRQNANHDHMVVRDPQNDYGEDWLEQHYTEHHPTLEEALVTARRRAAASQN
jgi:hypothetical protein